MSSPTTRTETLFLAAAAVVVTCVVVAALVAGVLAGGRPEGRPAAARGDDDTAQRHGPPRTLPGGGQRVFPGRFLVAYYGTPGTGSLGVLGEGDLDRMTRRLRAQAAPYAASGLRVQLVYEAVVTVADPHPGSDGDYSHDIPRARVLALLRAALRHRVLVVLDLQPGRSSFLTVARRWEWALRHPWVGLALDPEWRMGPRQVPGRTVGQVRASELNRTARWLHRLVETHRLPEKVFVLHQFRRDMVPDIDRVRPRRGLAMVQNVDGFGSPWRKLATFHAVVRPARFRLGLKLFYDEDTPVMRPTQVLAVRPRVRLVSYQ
jgi:hypothetical protein